MSRYSSLLPLLDELRKARSRSIGYDPEGYAEDRKVAEIKRIEAELDQVFAQIVGAALAAQTSD